MLLVSLVANAGLIIAMVVLLVRAKARIREEKLATFSGCLAAITAGLGHENKTEETTQTALALSSVRGGMNKDQISWMLSRAALIRLVRPAVAADMLGEHARLLMLQVVQLDELNDKVFDYINRWQYGMKEIREQFSDTELASAQFQVEKQVLAMYDGTISNEALKVF